jgi:hypothetical protein
MTRTGCQIALKISCHIALKMTRIPEAVPIIRHYGKQGVVTVSSLEQQGQSMREIDCDRVEGTRSS